MPPQLAALRVEQAALDDLRARLDNIRWAQLAHPDDWSYGTNAFELRKLVEYWRDAYDWRAHEASLNALPMFSAGLQFIHAKRHTDSIPLVLLHGWPDSIYGFYKVIPRLVDAGFAVIVPALPGSPLGGHVTVPAVQPTRHTAELVWELMTKELGYDQFAVAGGDGGSVLAQLIAIAHPSSVIGVHVTDLGWQASNVDPATLSRVERKYLAEGKKRLMSDGAYALVQSTGPRSLAALDDSPVGLASWVFDRFHSSSDSGFTKDELLTNIMLYWVTRTIGSSMFNYYADRQSPSLKSNDRVTRPVGVALFPKGLDGVPPRSFADRSAAVVRWTEMPRGGHFAALEEPALYADDVRDFFYWLTRGARPPQEHADVYPAL